MTILRLLTILVALALPVSSWAAISWVSTTDSPNTTGASTITMALTVPAGTDRLCVASVQARRSGGVAPSNVTGITLGGSQSFTFIRRDSKNNAVAIQTELWYLVAPTVATANVVVTFANALSDRVQAVSVTCLAGAGQSNQPDSHAGSNGTSATLSASLTTLSSNAWIVDSAIGAHSGGLTVGAGQTMRTDRVIGSGGSHGVGVSTASKATAGVEVMDWTQTSSDWAYSATSFSESGGAAPAPSVAGQVTLTWVNGTDPGIPASGVVNTVVRRGTGSGCNGATAPAIATVAYPLTTYRDTTVLANTSYCYSGFHTDGVGLTSTSHVSVPITTGGTPPATLPTIVSAVSSTTGTALVWSTSPLPTRIKVTTFTSLRVINSVTYTLAQLAGNFYAEDYRAGLQGVCFSAIDSNGNENTADSATRCNSLTSIVGPLDTTPPTLSGCQPTSDLPAGTTSANFSCNVNKGHTTARYHTSDVAYSEMPNIMGQNGLTFPGTITGLTNGSTTTLYLRPQLLGLSEIEDDFTNNYPALTSTVVTVTVAASTADTTPPGNVANLVCTNLGNTVSCTHDAATDAVLYRVFQATGACVDYSPAGDFAGLTSTHPSLLFGTTNCFKVKALDSSNNLSTNFSNIETETIAPEPDIERPSDMGAITTARYTNTVRLSWELGTDNSGSVFSNIESCAVATGQVDCANFEALVGEILQVFLTPQNLVPGATYCFRGRFSDPSGNVSLNYNTPVCVTTPLTGLNAPRASVPSWGRAVAPSRGAAGGRPVRP